MKSKILLASYSKRIVIEPGSSRLLFSLISSAHLAGLILLFYIDLHLSLLVFIAFLILLNLYRAISIEKCKTYRLSLQRGRPLMLQKHPHAAWEDVLVTESFSSCWLIVLKFKSLVDEKCHAVVCAADALEPRSYRHLVIYLNQHHG